MKAFLASAVLLLALPALVSADSIRLKDGSSIKGRVLKFSNNEFTVQLESSGSNSGSRAIINIDDVESIEFDSSVKTEAPVTATRQSSSAAPAPAPRSSEAAKIPAQPQAGKKPTQPLDEGDDDSLDSSRASRLKGPISSQPDIANVQATDVSVPATGEWTSTGITLKTGQRVRINSTGEVSFRSRTTGPDGIDESDQDKLLRDGPAGALIAVIGDDNDDFFLIGKNKQFTATRNGKLYFAVNEGVVKEYSGGFRCRIEVEVTPGSGKHE